MWLWWFRRRVWWWREGVYRRDREDNRVWEWWQGMRVRNRVHSAVRWGRRRLTGSVLKEY